MRSDVKCDVIKCVMVASASLMGAGEVPGKIILVY